jgi:hypothetical protein
MHQLVGRLTALDPEASESLKVIAYFDALVDGRANTEVLLRGAAVLSGCAAGFAAGPVGVSAATHTARASSAAGASATAGTSATGTVRRVDDAGLRSAVDAPPAFGLWPQHPLGDTGYVWLERSGPAHANDDMILERLALAVAITLERSAPVVAERHAVETVLDESAPVAERLAAAALLRLDATGSYEVVALPASLPATAGHQTVVVTRAGAVRAVIRPARDASAARVPGSRAETAAEPRTTIARAGIGFTVTPSELDSSWRSAVLALRLTGPREPVVRADELGALLLLADAADEQPHEHPDVARLKAAMGSSAATARLIEAAVSADSVRAAARELGLHHSTVQARLATLSDGVGFDVRTAPGRGRLALALRLYYLATNTFE